MKTGKELRKTIRVTAAGLCLMLLLGGCGGRLKKIEDYRRAGITALQEENYEEAVADFKHAMSYYGTAKQDFAGTDVLQYLAEAQFRAGDFAGAAESCERLLSADRKRPEYLNLECVCIVKSGGDLSQAADLYEEAGQAGGMTAEHMETLYTLGEAMTGSGDEALKERAMTLYQAAADSEGVTPEFCARLGRVLYNGGDTDGALQYFKEGIDLCAKELTAENLKDERKEELGKIEYDLRFNAAVCDEKAGNFESALSEMEALSSEYGEDDEILSHELRFLRGIVGEKGAAG